MLQSKKLKFFATFLFCLTANALELGTGELGEGEKCGTFTACSTGMEKRLAALENAVEKMEDENKNIKEENIGLRKELDALRKDVDDVEQVVTPWKVKASCQEHADRGVTENGNYRIRPNLNVNPFEVNCEFRK